MSACRGCDVSRDATYFRFVGQFERLCRTRNSMVMGYVCICDYVILHVLFLIGKMNVEIQLIFMAGGINY